jgi:glutaminyl-peptide cyclotransferase
MLFASALLSLAVFLSLGCAYHDISDESLRKLPGPGTDFDIKTGAILAPILRPRVSGTEGNVAVRQHFIDFFHAQLPEWRIELHNSTSTTPVSNGKEVPFVNFIATRDPPGALEGDVSRLALVAHYDSKLTPEGFIGATDSAAPCAMIMHIARSLDAALTKKWASSNHDNFDVDHKGLQILFLDGEEAFKSWTDDDSLYGARYVYHNIRFACSADSISSGHWLEIGSQHSTPLPPSTARPSTRLSFSFSSTSWAPPVPAYHHISR